MKLFAAALLGVLVLSWTGTAAAGPNIGFADDATKYADDGGNRLFTEMNKLGATTNRVAVFWNADAPTTIQDQAFLDRMIPVAKKHNIQIVFAIYPVKATEAPTTPDADNAFCKYAVKVMQRYPYVRKVIIGNEPNQPRFWQPIWNGSQPASPAAVEALLANCYDQIKGFDSSLDVIAAGLSPRGNDDPTASSNSSISPVRFIAALGTAYRMSGRTAPIFDEWSWHCYPNVNTDEVETGYAWPNTGCVNAARVKLALWDAFHGTGQPVLAGYTPATSGSTLFGNIAKMFIDETGWQVDTSSLPGYVNAENVPTISEAQQAVDYEQLVRLADCEPTLTDFHIFPMLDEADRSSLLQSGVLRVDFSERPSATDPNNSVQHAIGADQGSCSGGVWATLGNFLYSTTAVVPDYTGFPYQSAQPYASKKVVGGGIYVAMDAGEGFTYKVTFSGDGSSLTGSTPGDKTTATVKAPTGDGSGTATIVLSAQTNPSRTSTVTLDLATGSLSSGGGSSGGSGGSGGANSPELIETSGTTTLVSQSDLQGVDNLYVSDFSKPADNRNSFPNLNAAVASTQNDLGQVTSTLGPAGGNEHDVAALVEFVNGQPTTGGGLKLTLQSVFTQLNNPISRGPAGVSVSAPKLIATASAKVAAGSPRTLRLKQLHPKAKAVAGTYYLLVGLQSASDPSSQVHIAVPVGKSGTATPKKPRPKKHKH